MKMTRSLILIAAVVVIRPHQAVCQDIQISVSSDSVGVGERFFATVSVQAEAGYKVVFHDLREGPMSIGDVEFIKLIEIVEASDISRMRTDSATYEVAVFGIDSAFVGGIAVGIITPYSDTLIASAPSVLIGIRSVVPEDASSLHGLAPLATFPPVLWPWIVGGLVLLVACAIAFYYWRRQRARPLTAVNIEPTANPYDEALSRLRRLADTQPESEEEVRAYYIELSDTLRSYLEYTISVPALERTSAELISTLERLAAVSVDMLPDETIGSIRRTLDVSDLAKFANYVPGQEENEEVLGLASFSIESIERAKQKRLAETELAETDV